MRLKILNKLSEIAMPIASKKKQYGWKIKGSRKNIVDTMANALRKHIINIICINELDPAVKQPISVVKLFMDMRDNISGKFEIALKSVIVGGNTVGGPDAALASYYPSTEHIEISIPYGYSKEDYDIYMEIKKSPADENKFNLDVEKKINAIKAKGKLSSLFVPPKFTTSKKINAENITKMSRIAPTYKTQEDINNITDRIRPDLSSNKNPIKRKNINIAFSKLDDKFSTAFHEAIHAKQAVTQQSPGEEEKIFSKRKEQLNSFFAKENLPNLSINHYTGQDINTRPSLSTALGRFFYFSRPMEIDARIGQLRLRYRNIKKQAKFDYKKEIKKGKPDAIEKAKEKYQNALETRAAQVFDHSKKLQDGWAKTIEVYGVNYHTDKIATEELRAKYLYQYYLLISKDAKDIFNSDPRYAEELEKYKKSVEEINDKIEMLAKAGNLWKAPEEQKQKYKQYSAEG